MKCPKCGNAMQEGYFTLPNNFTFYPGEKKIGFVKGQIWLAGRWNLFGKQGHGYLCQTDKIASIEYGN